MKINDICADIYREECERLLCDCPELLDTEITDVTDIALTTELLCELDSYDFSEHDTLVGALREPRQLGICLKRKFYHIPAIYIEEYPIPKYIALYQSQRMFGDEVSGIRYYGEVKKCTPMRRSRIREIPKKSNELYYKFKVKSWERLDTLIESKELGFVRLFTSSLLLKNVSDVSALTILDAYEFKLYMLLRAASDAVSGDKIAARFSIDGFDIVFTKQVIYLCANQRIAERYWKSSLEQAPSKLLKKIKKDIFALLDKQEKNESEQT